MVSARVMVFNATDCIGSCKSNYHTITTTMKLLLSKGKGFCCLYMANIIHKYKFANVHKWRPF